MRHTTTTTSGHHHYPIAEALWILAGIIMLIAFGDALVLLALAFAIVTMTTVWWVYRGVEHRVERNDAEMALVSDLCPALTGQRDLKKTTAHASWRRRSAA
jgi:ABC-type bacteriocin/lantibiotic exporter with double-glycine peptidase domain